MTFNTIRSRVILFVKIRNNWLTSEITNEFTIKLKLSLHNVQYEIIFLKILNITSQFVIKINWSYLKPPPLKSLTWWSIWNSVIDYPLNYPLNQFKSTFKSNSLWIIYWTALKVEIMYNTVCFRIWLINNGFNAAAQM